MRCGAPPVPQPIVACQASPRVRPRHNACRHAVRQSAAGQAGCSGVWAGTRWCPVRPVCPVHRPSLAPPSPLRPLLLPLRAPRPGLTTVSLCWPAVAAGAPPPRPRRGSRQIGSPGCCPAPTALSRGCPSACGAWLAGIFSPAHPQRTWLRARTTPCPIVAYAWPRPPSSDQATQEVIWRSRYLATEVSR